MDEQKIDALKSEAQQRRQVVAERIGIPADSSALALMYHERSGIIVISLERASKGSFDRRLIFRHASEEHYREIRPPASDIHFSDPVSSPDGAILYYRASRITRRGPGDFSGEWLSVEKFHLIHHTSETVVTAGSLRLPSPYASGAVSSLHGVSSGGQTIFCRCALSQPGGGELHHWLCELQQATGAVSPLCRLTSVWF